MRRVFGLAVIGLALVAGCSAAGTGDATDDGTTTTTTTETTTGNNATTTTSGGTTDKSLAGDWRVLSAVVYFTNGKTSRDVKTTLPTRRLTVGADGSWQFGSSNGTWTVSSIEDADWTSWGVGAYGPTRKLVVNNWSNGTSKGPIEESTGPIDFFWVIYPYTSDGYGEGTVWMKFGKDN